jgi:hypothetical protein
MRTIYMPCHAIEQAHLRLHSKGSDVLPDQVSTAETCDRQVEKVAGGDEIRLAIPMLPIERNNVDNIASNTLALPTTMHTNAIYKNDSINKTNTSTETMKSSTQTSIHALSLPASLYFIFHFLSSSPRSSPVIISQYPHSPPSSKL